MSLRPSLRTLAIVAAAAATLSVGPAAAASSQTGDTSAADGAVTAAPAAVQPAGKIISSKWGWVTQRDPSAVTQPLAIYDQGNSSGGTNSVSYSGGGQYIVDFPGIGVQEGVANVTALGTKNRTCSIDGWYSFTPTAGIAGSDERVSVQCWNDSGAAAKSAFSVTFLNSAAETGRLAYIWDGDWTQTNQTPDQYNFNSTGALNRIHKNGVGDYRVTFPGLASTRGDVQVGNYVRFVPSPTAGVESTPPITECNVASWGPHGADLRVHVLCRGQHGGLKDSQFQVTFTQGEALKGPGRSADAYLFADRPTAASYHPASAFRFASPSGNPTVKHVQRGLYSVDLPSMPKGGAVIVTAYGASALRCSVTSIETSGPQQIGVRCRNFTGGAEDARFTLSFLR